MAPWKMAPSDAEDVEHDCSFFSCSIPGLSTSHIFSTFRQLPVQKILPSKSQREGERDIYLAARDRREAEPHPRRATFFVKGLHVVGHGTVTPQCSEVPDCGLLMSSGVFSPKKGLFSLRQLMSRPSRMRSFKPTVLCPRSS